MKWQVDNRLVVSTLGNVEIRRSDRATSRPCGEGSEALSR